MNNHLIPHNKVPADIDGIYRIDDGEPSPRGKQWIERIIFINGEVFYTEDYILVTRKTLNAMINQSFIRPFY
jgi:hypothetical protein